jgi:hypothetical protein
MSAPGSHICILAAQMLIFGKNDWMVYESFNTLLLFCKSEIISQ